MDVEVTFFGEESPFLPPPAAPRERPARPARTGDEDREPQPGQYAHSDERGLPVAGEVVVALVAVKCLDCPRMLYTRRSIRRGRGPTCERRHRARGT